MATININLGIFAVAAGTADVITAAYTPTTAAFYNGLYKQFRASGANTVVAPTLNVDGLGAKPIVKKGGNALVVGDIAGAGHVCEVSYNSTSEKWELLNPASDAADTYWQAGAGLNTLMDKRSGANSGDNGFVAGYNASNEGDKGQALGNGASNLGVEGQAIGVNSYNEFDRSTALGFESITTAEDQTNIAGEVRIQNFSTLGTKLLQHNNDGIVFDSNTLPSDTTATTQAEGDNSTKVATTAYADNAVAKQPEVIAISCSDLTTNLATGTTKGYIRMPFAMTLTSVKASVIDAPTGSTIIVDINESGSTILSTRITIDASEKTSATAATPPVISDTALANDAEITVDIDQIGSTNAGKGLIVYLIGTRA